MKTFGLMIVDKPIGPTSHRIVNAVRRGTGIRKVGHAGTLDPRASGVLVLCLGAATRLSEYLSTSSKRYEAVVRFGAATQTYDADGAVVRHTGHAPEYFELEEVLPQFRGEIEQVPPPYSAIKVKGKKAYELAREGKEVDLEPRQVDIEELTILSYEPPDLALLIQCSAGTYIRSLANDLGERLSTGAYLAALRRTKAGPFSLKDAIPFKQLELSILDKTWDQYVTPAVDALPDFPIVKLRPDQVDLIANGHRIANEDALQGLARGVGPDGELVAVLEAIENQSLWHPRKVFIS